jgi:hypothetical protein
MAEIKHVDRFHTGAATAKYKKGFNRIDWRKSTLKALANALKTKAKK